MNYSGYEDRRELKQLSFYMTQPVVNLSLNLYTKHMIL